MYYVLTSNCEGWQWLVRENDASRGDGSHVPMFGFGPPPLKMALELDINLDEMK